MKVGIVGCGYVFDHYMATWHWHGNLTIAGVADRDPERLATVCGAYNLRAYNSSDELLADPEIQIVVNLTSIESHFDVTRAALMAGKHVYSEKPLVTELTQAKSLFELAESRGLRLSCAPSNALGDTSQTMWKAVRDGAIGIPRIVYAEFDDNVIYKMHPETWRSRTGAPWPYIHEYEQGCTYEHIGYHLTWMCAIFGPVMSVTAFSKVALPDKTDQLLNPHDTPDFSVACLNFKSGVVGRVTCSIGVPFDHRMRIVGNEGLLTADTYRHYRSPVFLERFNQVALNARKLQIVRASSLLQKLFGVGGRRLKLLNNPLPGEAKPRLMKLRKRLSLRLALAAFKAWQLGRQDKAIGVAELAAAIAEQRPHFPPHDFTLHLTELTIAIQSAGLHSSTIKLATSFATLSPSRGTLSCQADLSAIPPPPLWHRLLERRLIGMHTHK